MNGLLFVGHVGKLIKVAGGVGNTHSKYGDRRMEIMWDCARIHCEEMAESDRNRLKDQVLASNTTEEAVIWLSPETGDDDCGGTDEAVRRRVERENRVRRGGDIYERIRYTWYDLRGREYD